MSIRQRAAATSRPAALPREPNPLVIATRPRRHPAMLAVLEANKLLGARAVRDQATLILMRGEISRGKLLMA